MTIALDTSVLVAALDAVSRHHDECSALLDLQDAGILVHALAETFNTLTGSRLGFRVPSGEAARFIREELAPCLQTVALTVDATLLAFDEAESRGVRGGAIYDYLHLVAARVAGAAKLYTLNTSHFLAFHRPGGPGNRSSFASRCPSSHLASQTEN